MICEADVVELACSSRQWYLLLLLLIEVVGDRGTVDH